MKLYQKIIGSFLLVAVMAGGALLTPHTTVSAAPKDEVTKGINQVGGNATGQGSLPDLIKNIINVLLFIVGAVAVFAIILGGIRFVTSSGDQAAVKAARETILYAVVGLVVAILAFAIVNFVVDSL